MENFKKAIENLFEESRQERKNVKIGAIGLMNIFNILSDEQKQELDDSFMMVLNNI